MADPGDNRGAKTKKIGKKRKKQATPTAQLTPPPTLKAPQTNLPPINPSDALLSHVQSNPQPHSQQSPPNHQPQQTESNTHHSSQQSQHNPSLLPSSSGANQTPSTSYSGVDTDNNDNLIWIEPDGDG